jgi:hypothetical protein
LVARTITVVAGPLAMVHRSMERAMSASIQRIEWSSLGL